MLISGFIRQECHSFRLSNLFYPLPVYVSPKNIALLKFHNIPVSNFRWHGGGSVLQCELKGVSGTLHLCNSSVLNPSKVDNGVLVCVRSHKGSMEIVCFLGTFMVLFFTVVRPKIIKEGILNGIHGCNVAWFLEVVYVVVLRGNG